MRPAGGWPCVQHGSLLVSCCVLGSQLSLGHGCEGTAARDWARQGGANRRRPRACRPRKNGGGAAPLTGRGPRGRPKERMLLADLGSAGTAGHAERTVGQAVRRHVITRKNIWDGGGSHRRSRAACTAALKDVATQTPLTPAPVRVRSSQGKAQLPHAL